MSKQRVIRTANIMTSSPNLPMSNSSLKKSNSELVTALKSSIGQNGPLESQNLKDDRSEYEITVKLFFLPDGASSRGQEPREHIRSAVDEVRKTLGVDSIDLLILSFPEITLDAEDTETFEAAELDAIVRIYTAAAELLTSGAVNSLGIAEFSAARLQQLCEVPAIASKSALPTVNQINLKDCCVMPRDLIIYAKKMEIKLFTHGDASNILPVETLKDVLKEDEAVPVWVCKYTAVVKSRGVIESKGYLVMVQE